MVYHGENIQFGGRFHHSLFKKPMNFSQLASSLGAASYRVTDPRQLCSVLNEALVQGRPTVIDAVIDVEEVPPIGARIKALNQFFEQTLIPVN